MISSNRYRVFFVITTLLIFSIEDSMLASEIDKAWYDKTEINGDFRLRYEGIYKKPGQDTDRERFRLRLGMKSSCLLYTSPSPRDKRQSRMPSSA